MDVERRSAGARVGFSVLVGVVVGIGGAALLGGVFAPLVGWIAAAATFLTVTWLAIGGMDAKATCSHATREDPSKHATQVIMTAASLASLGGVGVLLVQVSSSGDQQTIGAALGVSAIALSWLVVHTLFTLRYAVIYCTDGGGIDFNQPDEPPTYLEFAYLAFTIGMTFQVSDTNLTSHAIRATALRHSLLSYAFGTVILASTVNLVASLAAA